MVFTRTKTCNWREDGARFAKTACNKGISESLGELVTKIRIIVHRIKTSSYMKKKKSILMIYVEYCLK